MYVGIFSGCKAEEIQTTAWKGDEPTATQTDSLLEGTNGSEPLDIQVTNNTYAEVRSKRQTGSNNLEEHVEYMLFANRRFLVQMYLNTTIRNIFVLSNGNAISCDYDIR